MVGGGSGRGVRWVSFWDERMEEEGVGRGVVGFGRSGEAGRWIEGEC